MTTLARRHLVVGLAVAEAVACGARTELGAPALDLDASSRGDSLDASDADGGLPPPPCQLTAPVMLASGGKEIQFIALDETTVYWSDFALGTINAVPKAGGPSRVLAAGRGSPAGLVATAGTVFWTEFSGDDVTSTAASGGGGVATVAPNQDGAYEITAVDDEIYWTTLRGCTVARLGDGGSYELLAQAKQPFTSIVSNSALVVWVSIEQKAIERFDIATSTTSILLSGGSGSELPSALAMDDASVYFGGTSPDELTLSAISTDGKNAHTLYTSECRVDAGVTTGACLGDITTDGAFIYFTAATKDGTSAGNSGLVRKVPVSGGAATVVAYEQARPFAIAVDETCVYWGNFGDGTIWAAPK